jgi:hypothetical protein
VFRTRPAVAEIGLMGAGLVAGGIAATATGLLGLPVDERPSALLAAALPLGIVLAVGGPFVVRQSRDVTAEARPQAERHELARPGLLAVAHLFVGVSFVAVALTLGLELVGFGGLLTGFGVWYCGLAYRLRRWEHGTGRQLLLRPIYRWRGTNGRRIGRGWTDPANFVSGLAPPP